MYLKIHTGMFVFWSVQTGEPIGVAEYSEPLDTTTTGYATVVSSVALSRDATSIASGIKCSDRTGAIRRWDVDKA